MTPVDFQMEFECAMKITPDISQGGRIAAAVSGGPDSMAMLWLLSRWAAPRDISITAYTVDHGLRRDSAEEALKIGEWVAGWPGVSHQILHWEGEKPQTGILEEARAARYNLIAGAMKTHGMRQLFVAHHADDQAETFLIRLAKGSGLDGLFCMRTSMTLAHAQGDIQILRPMLEFSKEDLVRLCAENEIPYVRDPTNENEAYTRPRLRAARGVLEEEGLSTQRLCRAAQRMGRAQEALDIFARDSFDKQIIARSESARVFDYAGLLSLPEEIILRIILRAMEEIAPSPGYGPRLEKAESLVKRLKEKDFRGATLGGCRFSPDHAKNQLRIEKE
jgi:tRNA(Ile)-lysidine synthase